MLLLESKLKKIDKIIKEKDSFLLATPAPDGDSIGSLLALWHLLSSLNKKTILYVGESISPSLSFLDGIEKFSQKFPEERTDCVIVADTGHSSRLFGDKEARWRRLAQIMVNIDHHKGCDEFAHVNIIDSQAAATAEILFEFFNLCNHSITKEMAVCLLTSIVADTGAFKYPNVTPRTLKVSASLVELGAEIYPIVRELYFTKQVTAMKLAGHVFASLESGCNSQLVWGYMTRQMFELAGAKDEEGDKLVEELDCLKGVKVYCLFKENKDGKIKVSFRSRNKLSVRDVAAKFGGGGHLQAAGCELDGAIEDVVKKVLPSLHSLLEGKQWG